MLQRHDLVGTEVDASRAAEGPAGEDLRNPEPVRRMIGREAVVDRPEHARHVLEAFQIREEERRARRIESDRNRDDREHGRQNREHDSTHGNIDNAL